MNKNNTFSVKYILAELPCFNGINGVSSSTNIQKTQTIYFKLPIIHAKVDKKYYISGSMGKKYPPSICKNTNMFPKTGLG